MDKEKELFLCQTSDRPLWEQTVFHFKRLIEDGVLNEGEFILPHSELASRVGVGHSTLQRALSQLAKEGWIRRIPRAGTVVRSLKKHADEECWIAIMTRAFFDPGASSWDALVQKALFNCLGDSEYEFRMYPNRFVNRGSSGPQRVDPFLIRDIEEGLVAGLFICGNIPAGNQPLLQALKQSKVPRVEFSAVISSSLCDIVSLDPAAFMECAFSEIDQLEATSVGLLRVPQMADRELGDQLYAYQMLAEERGLERRQEWEITILKPTESEGVIAARKLLESEELPDILIITDDIVAKGAMTALAVADIDVPSDLKVFTKGNMDSGIRYQRPVTSINYDIHQLVSEGFRFLNERIEGYAGSGRRLLIAPSEVVPHSISVHA